MASLLVDTTQGDGMEKQQQLHLEEEEEEEEEEGVMVDAPAMKEEGEDDEPDGGDVEEVCVAVAAGEGLNGRGGGGEEEEEEEDDEERESAEMVRRLAQISMQSRAGNAPGVGASSPPGNPPTLPLGLGGEGMAKERNRLLISHMLSLANPVITENTLQFLSQRANLELLISFITLVPGSPEDDGPTGSSSSPAPGGGGMAAVASRPSFRPQRGEVLDKGVEMALARSFNAVLLLANDEPTEALMQFVGSKATIITEAIFEIFHPHARGSLHHGCRVIDNLLRTCTDQILMVVGSSKMSVKRYLGPMIRCIEQSPVAETFIKLICLPCLNQSGQYKATPAIKWRTFESLAEWRILVVLAEEVFGRNSTPEHASAAADVLIDLIERLAADENGELVLQPLGHTPELINGLVACALDPTANITQRCDCARVLVNTASRSAELQLPGVPGMGAAALGPGVMTLVPNQLRSVRNDYFKRLGSHLQNLCDCLAGEPRSSLSSQAVAHPGYLIPVPFSFLRLLLVTLLVEIVSADPKRLSKLQQSVWRVLCNWFFQYPFSNLYHGLFYKLVYQALRSGDEVIQQTVLSKCRLISNMVDAYVKGEKSAGNRGYILQFCNVVRLQAGTQAPSTWLRTFLKSHDSWRKFLPQLRDVTESQQLLGLGITVPSPQKRLMGGTMDLSGGPNPLGTGLMEPPGSPTAAQVSIDYGSALAKSLGFGEDEVEYTVDEGVAQTSHKRKKKKKKKGGGGGGGAKGEEEGDEDDEGDERVGTVEGGSEETGVQVG